MALASNRFVIPVEAQDGRPKLLVSVKRYTSPTASRSPAGLTLLLTHGVTFYKESWEPSLAHLFALPPGSYIPCHIREAWAIDSPNHGESAALNDHVICSGHLLTFRDYARAITAFLASGLLDLSTHYIIGIGHSAGSAPLIWAADDWYRKTNSFPFHSLILLEPSLISTALDSKYGNFNAALAAKALRRRNTWSSREEAAQWFGKHQKSWDPRCSALFAEYGLRSRASHVVLSCVGQQEAACYSVSEQEEVLSVLTRISPQIPIHAIFAEFVDLMPPEIRENIIDRRQGRRMASVTRTLGVGHFVPFENPEASARAIMHSIALSRGYVRTSGSCEGIVIEARL